MSELTEGVKLVKTRKAWDKLSAATETCGGKLKRGVAFRGGLEGGIQELLETLENWNTYFWCMLVLGLVFAGKKDDHSFFLQYSGVQVILSLVVPVSIVRCAWGISPQLVPLTLATATWDAETSGKTGFVKPVWDKLLEQWFSGDRASTSFVADTFSGWLHQRYCQPLVSQTSVRFFRLCSMVILVLWRIIELLRLSFHVRFECHYLLRLLSLSTVSALELTTATCNAETLGQDRVCEA